MLYIIIVFTRKDTLFCYFDGMIAGNKDFLLKFTFLPWSAVAKIPNISLLRYACHGIYG